MPITPFHFGPGLLFKSTSPRVVSFSAFCLAQVVTDMESLYFLVQGTWPVHRFLHTYVGATVTAVVTVAMGRGLLNWFFRRARPHFSDGVAAVFEFGKPIGWGPMALGAFLGTYSHVVLDSVMHSDIRPWAPFSGGNDLYELMGLPALHLVCVGAGLAGGVVYLLRRLA